MQKLIAAVAAVMVTGIAGFTVAANTAQEARIVRPAQTRNIETEEAKELELVVLDDEGYQVLEPRWVGDLVEARAAAPRGQAGTWQIIALDKATLLLNTASGETFSLEKGDDGLHWKPVPRPMGQDMPAPRMRDDAPKTDREETQRRIDELRQKLRKTEGEDARERIENMIRELEQALEKADGKRDVEKRDLDKRDAEKRDVEKKEDARRDKEKVEKDVEKNDFEAQMQAIEDKIHALKEKWEASDSVKEREKLEKAIQELKEKAEALRKERKDR